MSRPPSTSPIPPFTPRYDEGWGHSSVLEMVHPFTQRPFQRHSPRKKTSSDATLLTTMLLLCRITAALHASLGRTWHVCRTVVLTRRIWRMHSAREHRVGLHPSALVISQASSRYQLNNVLREVKQDSCSHHHWNECKVHPWRLRDMLHIYKHLLPRYVMEITAEGINEFHEEACWAWSSWSTMSTAG